MNYLDIIIAIPILYGAFKGFQKGFIIEAASLASLIVGVFIAIIVSDTIGQIAVAVIDWNPLIVKIIAFIIAFILVVMIVFLFAKSLEKIIKIAGLNIFNRLAGLAAGIIKMAFFISLILIVINSIGVASDSQYVSEEKREKSILYNRVENFAHHIIPNKDFLQKHNIFSNNYTEDSCNN